MSGAVVGWDVGGAHLKSARVEPDGRVTRVLQLPCRLWLGLDELDGAVRRALEVIGPAHLHAVTMTGEMADLFADRRDGVRAISERMSALCAPAAVECYAAARGFVRSAIATNSFADVASMNWHASAALAATRAPTALFVDIGSTTTDVVALVDGRPAPLAADDAGRLASAELVYLGVVRTAVAAIAPHVPVRGRLVPMMAETFATAADVFRLCGTLPDEADQHPTADGADKSREASARRLLRMVGIDWSEAERPTALGMARWLSEAALRRVHDAAATVLSRRPECETQVLVGAGAGRFIARALASRLALHYVDFAEIVAVAPEARDAAATCAPAVAVAVLAQRCGS